MKKEREGGRERERERWKRNGEISTVDEGEDDDHGVAMENERKEDPRTHNRPM